MSISAVVSTISAVISTISTVIPPVATVMTSVITSVVTSVVSSVVTSMGVTIMMSMMPVVIPVSSVVVMVAGRCLQIFRLISVLGWSRFRPSLYGDFPPASTETQEETEGEDGLDLHDGWTAGLVVGQCEGSVRRPGQLRHFI